MYGLHQIFGYGFLFRINNWNSTVIGLQVIRVSTQSVFLTIYEATEA
jgi:hypothetical protein